MRIYVCSDLHRGPLGHRGLDETLGWDKWWVQLPEPKYRLGDMDDEVEFAGCSWDRAGTDISGNHDPGTVPEEIRINDTILIHGHQFDNALVRIFNGPAIRFISKLENVWPDAEIGLWLAYRKLMRIGRYGDTETYARRAARYAKNRDAGQIVFGHLHCKPFMREINGVHVVNCGCCCNGKMDFVSVEA